MNTTLRHALVATFIGASALVLPTLSHAADVTRGDILSLFEMPQIDKNNDHMVSKKEFMDMMGKAWDMEAAQMKAKEGKMTAEQFREFSKMFNLNIGA